MQRRDFIATSLAAGAATMTAAQTPAPHRQAAFKLKYAPHFGMFRNAAGDDPIDQLKFAADQGFTAWEHNGMAGESVEFQENVRRAMDDLGITMGVFVVSMSTAWGPHFVEGKQESRDQFLRDCENAVEVAKRVNAKWMTVVCGTRVPNLEMGYQTANVVDQLRRAAEIFEPHGLVMVLEPLNPWRDHPNMFLAKIPHAYEVCRAVNSPSCKILFDIYHQQITEGNLIPNMDLAWNEIAYFQVGDNPGRREPGTGEINYRNVFRHIHDRGFTGVVGMEHGNSREGEAGDRAVVEAYRAADAF